jgi:hydroxymethylbilane synthase
MTSIYAKGRADVHHFSLLFPRMTAPLLRIASRGSALSQTQARFARARLASAHGWPEAELDWLCPIISVKTSGDRIQDKPLAEAGGKGLFVKEIEEVLLAGEADIAVHSLKDMPGEQPKGLIIAAVLPREDPHDVFVARDGKPFSALKRGARVGTSSVRRQAQLLRMRPDIEVTALRGNVETRLAKLARGEADAAILAQAGLRRLGLAPAGGELLDGENWLPALCQGAIGIELRDGDTRMRELAMPIDDKASSACIACERGFLAALDGSCRTPIAGLATISGGRLRFRGEVLTLDGRHSWTASREIMVFGVNDEALFALGNEAAMEIRNRAGDRLPRF